MSRLFLTKVWGFSPEDYPALGFNTVGARRKYMKESSPGDWVVFAGTKGTQTAPDDRGRLLGMVQLGMDEIDVEEVLRSIGTPTQPHHYDDNGNYRWPFGLPMLQARRFVGKPDLFEILGTYLQGMQWASFALDLEEKVGTEARLAIEALTTEPIEIVEASAIRKQRLVQEGMQLHKHGGPTGPGPSTSRSGSEREEVEAVAYLLALRGARRPIFKVGYTSDLARRLSELNVGLMSSVTKHEWQAMNTQRFQTETLAYRFEQRLHRRLARWRLEGEGMQEVYECPEGDLLTEWVTVYRQGEWAVD